MAAAKAVATGWSARPWRARAKADAASSEPTSTTRFRSDIRSFSPEFAGRRTGQGNRVRRFANAGLALVAPVLLACSAGHASKGFIDPRLMSVYIPLSQSYDVVFSRWGAALTVAPNIAVTNDHNLNFIAPDRVLARSRNYDLLFFRTDFPLPAMT